MVGELGQQTLQQRAVKGKLSKRGHLACTFWCLCLIFLLVLAYLPQLQQSIDVCGNVGWGLYRGSASTAARPRFLPSKGCRGQAGAPGELRRPRSRKGSWRRLQWGPAGPAEPAGRQAGTTSRDGQQGRVLHSFGSGQCQPQEHPVLPREFDLPKIKTRGKI